MKEETMTLAQLKEYIDQVNEDLRTLKAQQVNSLFELYLFSATLGATSEENAAVPDGAELHFELYTDTLNTLELRCSDPNRFLYLAASCIHASAPDGTSLQQVMNEVSSFVRRVQKDPKTSIASNAILLNGDTVRTYYSYYPNLYHDEMDWYGLTVVFAFTGLSGEVDINNAASITESSAEYEGYFASDEGDHYEYFVTPTPEPDSPAYGFWELEP